MKERLLFEVSENTVRSETRKMGELQRQADQALVNEMQEEESLQQRERSQPVACDILYGSIDAQKYGSNRASRWKTAKPGVI